MIPCSAAIVIGIVCEAEVAFSAVARAVALVLAFRTSPSRSPAADAPRTVPGRRRSGWRARSSRCWSSRPSPSGRSAGWPARRAARPARPRRAPPRRRASRARPSDTPPSTARPSSSAAMLDCEKLVTSPASSQASSAAPISTSRRRALHSTRSSRRHHEREEAPVDARVEEQRVDAEVVVELVGRHDLRVQEQRLAVVLDEADAGEQDRQPDRHAEAREHQARREAHLAERQEEQRERDVEEREFSAAFA